MKIKLGNVLTKAVKGSHKVVRVLGKNSPLLLTIGGVIGLGATAYLSYKAAAKVEAITDDIENRRNDEQQLLALESKVHEEGMDTLKDYEKKDLIQLRTSVVPVDRKKELVRLAGAVALPVTTGVASIGAIALSYYIMNNRLLSVAASLATATAENAYYRNKYRETYGDDEANKFFTPTHGEAHEVEGKNGKTKEEQVEKQDYVHTLTGDWFDHSSEYASDDMAWNIQYIKGAEESMQLALFRKGYISLNEVRDALGLDRDPNGAQVGWTETSNFQINRETVTCLNPKTGQLQPQLYVKWPTPKSIWDVIEYKD
jgi:uncharacterized protein YdbL (DUF1318 family)